MRTTTLLLRAVRKLGPERSRMALKAWSSDGRRLGSSTFQTCALARAYGEKGELQRVIDERRTSPTGFVWSVPIVAKVFGLTEEQTQALVDCFDGELDDCDHRTLRGLLAAEARKRPKRVRTLRRQPHRGGR